MESAERTVTGPSPTAPAGHTPDPLHWLPPYPWGEECDRPSRWVRLGARAFRLAVGASVRRPHRFGRAFRRAIHLLGREHFTPREVRRLGLLRQDVTPPASFAVSRRAMQRIAEALNPADERPRIADKSAFQHECERRGLPVPRLVAVYHPDRAGWTFTGGKPATAAQWEQFLAASGPDEFIVKPVTDGWGRGVRFFARTADGLWRDAAGTTLDAARLVAWMYEAGRSRGCILQERVRGHAELERLSGSRFLQTIRFITLLDRAGSPHLLHAHFKIITGSNCVDNFMYGASGNLIATVNLADGLLERARAADPRGGFREAARHPDTGIVLGGIRLPGWREAGELALRAAREFAPLRFVGWDIAPTPDGPVLIEGNWNTDPPNHGGRMDEVLAEIRRRA